jgi:hypothetical protein
MKEKKGQAMTQELDNKIRNLRAELTRLVSDGADEDGMILRRLLAELERLENQRMTLRGCHTRTAARGGAHARLAA